MNTRERPHDQTPPPTGATGPGAGLTRLRGQGQGFLGAADAAINRALGNHNSQDFLSGTRQDGGQ